MSAKKVCRRQQKILDESAVRHIFTFQLLEQYGCLQCDMVVCVIGDSQANFVSLGLMSKSFRKVISVNLAEVLLNDLPLIESIMEDSEQVVLARSRLEFVDALKDDRVKIILCLANESDLLLEQQIDLFVNIASFQEMRLEEIERYFRIVQSNNALLYSCNRLQKRLYGGEVINFQDYPWGNSRVILDELCPWHQYYYSYSLRSLQLLRIQRYEGETWHRLAKFESI